MVALFAFSLTGLMVIVAVIAVVLRFLVDFANAHPEAILISVGIIWLYLYDKSRMANTEVQNNQMLMQQEQDMIARTKKPYRVMLLLQM